MIRADPLLLGFALKIQAYRGAEHLKIVGCGQPRCEVACF